MNTRRGMGRGTGKIGYYNLAPMDSHIHSLSAKGVKSYSLNSKWTRTQNYWIKDKFGYSHNPTDLENIAQMMYNKSFIECNPSEEEDVFREDSSQDYEQTKWGKPSSDIFGHIKKKLIKKEIEKKLNEFGNRNFISSMDLYRKDPTLRNLVDKKTEENKPKAINDSWKDALDKKTREYVEDAERQAGEDGEAVHYDDYGSIDLFGKTWRIVLFDSDPFVVETFLISPEYVKRTTGWD